MTIFKSANGCAPLMFVSYINQIRISPHTPLRVAEERKKKRERKRRERKRKSRERKSGERKRRKRKKRDRMR
jgi:hypothetical protein